MECLCVKQDDCKGHPSGVTQISGQAATGVCGACSHSRGRFSMEYRRSSQSLAVPVSHCWPLFVHTSKAGLCAACIYSATDSCSISIVCFSPAKLLIHKSAANPQNAFSIYGAIPNSITPFEVPGFRMV